MISAVGTTCDAGMCGGRVIVSMVASLSLRGSAGRRPTRDSRDSKGGNMIVNDEQMQTTQERIAWFQKQVTHLRKTETNPVNYRAAVAGFLAEMDRMQLEVREYFS